jgi:hypothetical protein
MFRRRQIFTLAAILMMAGPAFAESVADQISRQLRGQGFGQISVSQTWLGRTRIIGNSDKGQREIIVNPKTGEILRDLFTQASGGTANPVIGRTGSGGDDNGGDDNSGSGGDDDNGGDDNSGSGGGDDNGGDDNSGSGGGDGDSGGDDDKNDDSGDDDN